MTVETTDGLHLVLAVVATLERLHDNVFEDVASVLQVMREDLLDLEYGFFDEAGLSEDDTVDVLGRDFELYVWRDQIEDARVQLLPVGSHHLEF